MAKKMLIVHGYSDGSGSFEELGDFFVAHAGYSPKNIYYADYSSMDDEATFRDFGDKLDEDYERELISEALRRADGVQKAAAELLGLKPSTLSSRMRALGIKRPR